MNLHPLDDADSPIVATVADQDLQKDEYSSTIKIWHLILFTTLIAAVVALYQVLESFQSDDFTFGTDTIFEKVQQIIGSCLLGSALAGLIILAIEAFSRKQLIKHPGHWILLTDGIAIPFILGGFAFLVISIHQGMEFGTTIRIHTVVLMFSGLLTIVVGTFLLIFYFKHFTWYWIVALLLTLFSNLLQVTANVLQLMDAPNNLQFIFAYAPQLVPLLGFVGILVAVIIDLVKKYRRDWLHWLGVGLFLFQTAFFSITFFIRLISSGAISF